MRTSSMANMVCCARFMEELAGSSPEPSTPCKWPTTVVTIDSAFAPLPRCRCTIKSRILAITSAALAGAAAVFPAFRVRFSEGNGGSRCGFAGCDLDGMVIHWGHRSTWKEEVRPHLTTTTEL